MNFVQAIQSGFRNYVTFSGRAQRSAYWWWTLFTVVLQVGADLAISETLGSILAVVLLLPSIAVGMRRLHDLDRSGWWILLWFVPIVGWIVLIYWACCKGTEGPNRFGPDPLAMAPDTAPAADA
jgi:uncharacterized membrane protein YhaH (DUF805 family)